MPAGVAKIIFWIRATPRADKAIREEMEGDAPPLVSAFSSLSQWAGAGSIKVGKAQSDSHCI